MYRGGGVTWEKIADTLPTHTFLQIPIASHIEILPSTVKLVNDYDTSKY